MATFIRYRPVLNGWQGGPGINTWHATSDVLPIVNPQAQQFADEIRVAYLAMAAYFVSGVSITFPTEVTEHDEATGQLVTVHTVTSPAAVTSTAGISDGNLSRATCAVVKHQTTVIRDGKRLTGRHFIGPIPETAIQNDGTMLPAARTAIASAYGGLLDVVGPNLYVVGVPKKDANGVVTSPGKIGRVTGVSVIAIPGTLRSRKV